MCEGEQTEKSSLTKVVTNLSFLLEWLWKVTFPFFIIQIAQLALKEIKLHSPAEITSSDFPKMMRLVCGWCPEHTVDHSGNRRYRYQSCVCFLSQTPNGLLLTPSPLLSSIHFWSSLSPVAPLSPARLQGPSTLFQVSI